MPGRSDLPIETVRRLTCDGSLITIVEDDDGTPLDVGRKRRTVTTALKRALWARDRHCSFPGCHNRCYVDAHHIEHWAEGGATSLDNPLGRGESLHGGRAVRRARAGGSLLPAVRLSEQAAQKFSSPPRESFDRIAVIV